jgi:hypothetical protein
MIYPGGGIDQLVMPRSERLWIDVEDRAER